jgi:MshEN domain
MDSPSDRFRLRVDEPARLRDYFGCLGVHAEIDEEDLVVVTLAAPHADLSDYLHSWSLGNSAEIVPPAVEVVAPPPAPAPPPVKFFAFGTPRLGDMLVQKGLISAEQMQDALIESHASGKRLGEVLIERQWLFEDELARTLAGQLGLLYVNLRSTGVDLGAARTIPANTGIRFAVIPIGVRGGVVQVAFADPTDDEAREAVAAHLPSFEAVIAELSEIRSAWRRIGGNAPY